MGRKLPQFSNSCEHNLNSTGKAGLCQLSEHIMGNFSVLINFKWRSSLFPWEIAGGWQCMVCAFKLEKCINEQDVARLILQRPLSGNIGSQRFRINKEECRAGIFYSPREQSCRLTWIMQRPAVCVSLRCRRLLHKELIILLGCWSCAQQMRSSFPFISLNPRWRTIRRIVWAAYNSARLHISGRIKIWILDKEELYWRLNVEHFLLLSENKSQATLLNPSGTRRAHSILVNAINCSLR